MEILEDFSRKIINHFEGRVDAKLDHLLNQQNFFSPRDWRKAYHNYEGNLIRDVVFLLRWPRLKQVLESPCPYEKDKKIKDTHFLYCLPRDAKRFFSLEEWQQIHPRNCLPYFYTNLFNRFTKSKGQPRYKWYLIYQGILPIDFSKSVINSERSIHHDYELPLVCELLPFYFLAHHKHRRTNAVKEKNSTLQNLAACRPVKFETAENEEILYVSSELKGQVGVFVFRRI